MSSEANGMFNLILHFNGTYTGNSSTDDGYFEGTLIPASGYKLPESNAFIWGDFQGEAHLMSYDKFTGQIVLSPLAEGITELTIPVIPIDMSSVGGIVINIRG